MEEIKRGGGRRGPPARARRTDNVNGTASNLKDWVVRNLGFKIVALVVAVVIWFGVKADRQTEVRYPIALEIQPGSDDLTILGPVPETVDVIFAGTGRELLRLGDQNYRVRKRLERGPAGPRRVPLDVDDVTGGGNPAVKPIGVAPAVLTVTVDRVVAKRVPLRAEGELEPAEGYALAGPIKFDPPAVTLIGARTILSTIDTLPVDLSEYGGGREPIRQAISLRIPKYPSVIVQPDSIRVMVAVEEASRPSARWSASRS